MALRDTSDYVFGVFEAKLGTNARCARCGSEIRTGQVWLATARFLSAHENAEDCISALAMRLAQLEPGNR